MKHFVVKYVSLDNLVHEKDFDSLSKAKVFCNDMLKQKNEGKIIDFWLQEYWQ